MNSDKLSLPLSLTGKKALITGASGGIGSAIGDAFVAAGAVVTLHGRRTEALQKLKDKYGDKCHTIACDLTDSDSATSLVTQSASHWDGLDIVVSNAGVTRDQLLLRLKDEAWLEVLAVNLTVAMALTRAALPAMTKQRWGRVIMMSSVVAAMGNGGQSAYASAKAGMGGLVRSVAQEVGKRGVTVNAIAPGFIDTPMTEKLPDAVKETYKNAIPLGCFGEPDDVAAAALYLAGDSGRYVTGQTLHVNGGLWMGL